MKGKLHVEIERRRGKERGERLKESSRKRDANSDIYQEEDCNKYVHKKERK